MLIKIPPLAMGRCIMMESSYSDLSALPFFPAFPHRLFTLHCYHHLLIEWVYSRNGGHLSMFFFFLVMKCTLLRVVSSVSALCLLRTLLLFVCMQNIVWAATVSFSRKEAECWGRSGRVLWYMMKHVYLTSFLDCKLTNRRRNSWGKERRKSLKDGAVDGEVSWRRV